MTLQLMATGIYYLYFVIMKLFPHYEKLKADLIPIFSNTLLDLKENFNPRALLEHTVDTKNLNTMLMFVRTLQAGYTNPYDPGIPLPDAPQFDPRKVRAALMNFRKLPTIPNYIPKIIPERNVRDSDDGDEKN